MTPSTQESIRKVRLHLRFLSWRYVELGRKPGGRTELTPDERVEYDTIGGLMSTLRCADPATYAKLL